MVMNAPQILLLFFFSSCLLVQYEFDENLELVTELTRLYSYNSVAVFVDTRADKGWRKLVKNVHRIQIFDNLEKLKTSQILSVRKNALFIFSRPDRNSEIVFELIADQGEAMPDCGIFIKTGNKSDLVNTFGKYLRFDSNFNLLVTNHQHTTEIHEVYSATANNLSMVKTNMYGVFSQGNLDIEDSYLWDRRTDFLGIHFRSFTNDNGSQLPNLILFW